MRDLIEIDGSHGEGGGQMMRSAVALSLLTSIPFRMINIRAGRATPGLKAQHMHALKAASRVWRATVAGANVGSQVVMFHPGRIKGATFEVNIGTAGSLTLLLQALLPAMLFADGRTIATLRGGTDVNQSPTWEFFARVVAPAAAPLANRLEVACGKRGFYPKGGGEVRIDVEPRTAGSFGEVREAIRSQLPPVAMVEAGGIESIDVVSIAHEELRKQSVVERQLASAVEALGKLRARVVPHKQYVEAMSIGTAVTVVASLSSGARLGADALGERGKRAEEVGREAAAKMVREIESGAPVDEHLGDHLVPWLALRGGSFRTSVITEHTRTNCWLVEQFLGPTFGIDEGSRIISCLS